MKIVKSMALVLVLCVFLCGCGPTVYEDDPPYTGTFAGTSDTEKTDSEWNELLSYAEYLALPAAERSAFVDSFEDPSDFSAWLKAVKRIYDAEQKGNEIGQDGVIDMEDINP